MARTARRGHREARGRHRQAARSWRSGPLWRRVRALVIARDRVCQVEGCGQGPGDRSNPLTADHIVPVKAGGALYALSNLQAMCRRHNSAKGAR